MKIVKAIIALLCALGGDILINKIFSFQNPLVDPYMIAVVYFATESKPVSALFFGTAAGLIEDTWRELIFGLNGFNKTFIGYVVAVLSSIFDFTGVLPRTVILLAATAIDALMGAGLMALLGKGVDITFFSSMGIRIAGNLILGIAVFSVMSRLRKRKYSEAL